MTLKSLNKVLVDIKFAVIVFKGNEYIEDFTVSYAETTDGNLDKLHDYANATVRHLSINHATGLNNIEIEIK